MWNVKCERLNGDGYVCVCVCFLLEEMADNDDASSHSALPPLTRQVFRVNTRDGQYNNSCYGRVPSEPFIGNNSTGAEFCTDDVIKDTRGREGGGVIFV